MRNMVEKERILEGKRVIINGASKGIGKAVAVKFAELGAKLGLISRNEKLLKENVNIITQRGGTAFYEIADVSDYEQLKTSMEELIAKLDGIDVLINNAGIAKMNYIPESVDEIDQIIDINLKGVIYGTHIALPYFKEQKKGSIINTSSGSALVETNKMMTNTALYASTKAGINLYSFCAAQKLPKRIRINSMMPGWTKTDIVAQAGQDINNHLKKYFDVAEDPAEIVPFYTFYASDESKRITGALVNFVLLRMAIRFVKEYMEQPTDDWAIIGPALEKYSRGIYRHVKDHVKLLKFLLKVDAKGSTMMPR